MINLVVTQAKLKFIVQEIYEISIINSQNARKSETLAWRKFPSDYAFHFPNCNLILIEICMSKTKCFQNIAWFVSDVCQGFR